MYRDLDALQAAGFPIYKKAKNGSNRWELMDTARQQIPIPLNLQELMALYFGLDMLKVLKDTVFYESLESFFQKVKSTLPPESKKFLGQVEKSLRAKSGPHKKYDRLKAIIDTINKAVTEKKVVEMVYYTMSRKKVSRREVAPYKIWFFDGTLYLIGHCRLKNEVRIFAVDRINMLNLTGEKFRIPNDFNIDEFMQNSFGIYHGDPVKIKVHFSADAAGYVKEKTWHASQRIQELSDGSIIFEVNVSGTDEIKLWIMRWGSKAYVLEPETLRDEIYTEAAGMLAMYENGVGYGKEALSA